MAKKGLCVWLFSCFTFLSVAHLVDALYAVVSSGEIRILQLYPFIGERLRAITPISYLWASAATTMIFWGITCAIAFENPMEEFLKRMLSDAKKQSAVETQLVEDRSEILDAMYETIESSNESIAHIKDMMYNVRTEMKEIQPLAGCVDKVKVELSELKKELRRLEERVEFPHTCFSCGKPILPEFKICPYCGENARISRVPVIALEGYK